QIQEVNAHRARRILHRSLAATVRIRDTSKRRVEPVVNRDDRNVVLVEPLPDALKLSRERWSLRVCRTRNDDEREQCASGKAGCETADRHCCLRGGSTTD